MICFHCGLLYIWRLCCWVVEVAGPEFGSCYCVKSWKQVGSDRGSFVSVWVEENMAVLESGHVGHAGGVYIVWRHQQAAPPHAHLTFTFLLLILSNFGNFAILCFDKKSSFDISYFVKLPGKSCSWYVAFCRDGNVKWSWHCPHIDKRSIKDHPTMLTL